MAIPAHARLIIDLRFARTCVRQPLARCEPLAATGSGHRRRGWHDHSWGGRL